MTTATNEDLQRQLATALHERNLLRDAIVEACVKARIVNAEMAPTIDGPLLLQLANDLAEVGEEATSPAREKEAQDARYWNGLITCARIRVLGTAGVQGHQPGQPDYVHFGAEFWTKHDAATADPAYTLNVLTTFADAALAVANQPAAEQPTT